MTNDNINQPEQSSGVLNPSWNKKQTVSEAFIEWVHIIKRFRLLIPLFIVSGASWGLTISYLPLFLDEKTLLALSSIGIIVSL